MVIGLALPKHETIRDTEIAATFVVPAPGGCNLKCSFCAIRARGEATGETSLRPEDYVSFLKSLASRESVALVSLQGYEPLLPASWAYTRALLEAARSLGIRTSMVTNGTYLAERVQDLDALGLASITVSLDSADPEAHDRIRGVHGAFDKTLSGIRAAIGGGFWDRLFVGSVLQPGKGFLLNGMPALLKFLGLSAWVVTPLVRFRDRDGSTVESPSSIVFEARRLKALAEAEGVRMALDNELDAFSEGSDFGDLAVRRLKRVDQIVRLSPTGVVSRGETILRKVGVDDSPWKPEVESADSFLNRFQARTTTKKEAVAV